MPINKQVRERENWTWREWEVDFPYSSPKYFPATYLHQRSCDLYWPLLLTSRLTTLLWGVTKKISLWQIKTWQELRWIQISLPTTVTYPNGFDKNNIANNCHRNQSKHPVCNFCIRVDLQLACHPVSIHSNKANVSKSMVVMLNIWWMLQEYKGQSQLPSHGTR